MKYVLALLLCVVSVIGGVAIGMHLNTKNPVALAPLPGTSADLIQCSDVMAVAQLKNVAGKITSVSTSSLSLRLQSGKTVPVVVDSHTTIQRQTLKDAAVLKTEEAAYQKAQAKAKVLGTTTVPLIAPLPFVFTPIALSQLPLNVLVNVMSGSGVIGQATIRASSITIVATSSSTSTNAH